MSFGNENVGEQPGESTSPQKSNILVGSTQNTRESRQMLSNNARWYHNQSMDVTLQFINFSNFIPIGTEPKLPS